MENDTNAPKARGRRSDCQWSQDEDGNWKTSCGEMFIFLEDGPKENEFRFCCYCGGALTETATTEVTDDRRSCGVTPRRVRLSTKKGWKIPENTVKVDRSTRWGNPFLVIRASSGCMGRTAAQAVTEYERWLQNSDAGRMEVTSARIMLRGKNLGCWCALDQPCHADTLLRIANARSEERT